MFSLYWSARNKFKNIVLEDRPVIGCAYLAYTQQKVHTETQHIAINCLSHKNYNLDFMILNCCNNLEYLCLCQILYTHIIYVIIL